MKIELHGESDDLVYLTVDGKIVDEYYLSNEGKTFISSKIT